MKRLNMHENLTQEGISLQNENNRKVKEEVITKSKNQDDGLSFPSRYERYLQFRKNLRGTSRPKILSFRETKRETSEVPQKINQITNPPHSGQRVYGTNGISPTLTTGKKVNILIDGQVRKLTETEWETLQGFSKGWTEGISSTQRYKCLGNAVTVNVVYEIAKNL
jgi:site-specific DNA-cytosine methylase